ncbi:MAG TPA: cell division protein ZipA C-terminal FtsZ-binding domain-containing protein [Steroidobacteraceae bacterium]|nr:cell division protein ZipA C-terminal FtsZ-binding domain-containing protein [Steroidobacteraceae bacterium]
MPELRWALALLGVVFLGGLAFWELRRPRQSARGEHESSGRETRAQSPSGPHTQGPVHREPSISFPEIRTREPVHELPTVEIAEDSLIGLRADGARDDLEEPFSEEIEPIVPLPEQPSPPAALLGEASAAAPEARSDPIVEWPEEGERRIVALRVVAPGERFSGRAVRQALIAEGFVLGKFSIFHRCGPDGRAVVSAANLTKPGTFDQDAIDMQRFGGLNLFAVLPGPLPAVRAFDELVSAARNLCERLEGALQDESGEPLTPLRTAALREALANDA